MEVGGKVDVVPHGAFQAAVEDQVLLAAVGHDFDFAHHDVGAIHAARHARGERQFEFPDALGFERELRAADASGFHGEGLGGNVVHQGEPVVGLQLQAHVAGGGRVVVGGDGNGDAIALREGDGQIEIDEEILKDLEAAGAAAERAVRGGGQHRHAPRGDGVRHRNHDAGAAIAVGDDFGIDVERLREVGAHVRSGGADGVLLRRESRS